MHRVTDVATHQTASMEDYLETIALLSKEGKAVKVTQISKALGVKKPSVTSALAKLSEAGLVIHERYGGVQLTADGESIAQDVYRRHETLRRFLVEILNVDAEEAEENACRMEHALGPASLERLANFLEFVFNCPQGKPEWLKGFRYYSEHGERNEELMARCQRKGNAKD